MSRAVRIEFPGALYHVMSRGVARLPTFLDDEDRNDFLRRIEPLVRSGDLVVHAFCLMPNHYHLLCETPAGGLRRWMRHVNGDYARAFNHRHRRVGHLWQGRFKAVLVEDGRYLTECSRYIHLNPNRAKITRPAERYWWSSYRNYVGGPAVVDCVETERVLAEFAGDRKRYREYVEEGKGEKPVSPFERAAAGLILGAEAFVRRIRGLMKGLPQAADQPAWNELRRIERPSPEQIEAWVDDLFRGETPRRRGRLRLYALRRHSGLGTTRIAERYGRTPAAVPVAVKAIDGEAKRSRTLARRLAKLARLVDGEKN